MRACLPIALLLSLAACNDDTKSYGLGGQVSELYGNGLVLTNRNATPLSVSPGANSFVFPFRIRKGSQYSVTVATQPTGQICTVTNGSGTVRSTVANIRVSCSAETHSIAGSITGLSAGGLVLQLNGADDLSISANANSFEFATPVAAGSGYQVTVLAQPSGLTCTVNNGTASNINADIANVQVVCSATTHGVGGTVSGLSATGLVLQNNGADDLTVASGASSFQFASPVADSGTYNVSVLAQPAGQTCSVMNGSGTAQSTITNVVVTCANVATYFVTPSAGANGSISPSTAQAVNEGGSIAFTATPDSSYAVSQWLVNGSLAQTGGSVYSLTNVSANATVQVTFGTVALTPSVSTLALSVNDTATNAALTGTPRVITFTNTGSLAADNVSLNVSALPAGTFVSPASCGTTLAAGDSCVLTLTPGINTTSSCTSGIAPTPSVVTLSADNAADAAVDVVVLSYGCIYQSGHLFAVDDTTAWSFSIGGKVAATVDQANPSGSGVIWSSNGNGGSIGDVDYQNLGVAQSSTSPCTSAFDGACNTTTILSYYASTPRAYFAAGQCAATISGYSDWYLPADCELGTCGVGQQSIQANLVEFNNLDLLLGLYWSSTEHDINPQTAAAGINFASGYGSSRLFADKRTGLGVRCARALSP
ncbi:InlB B-repeat-containing protein [Steroidobacter sp.]|uniref:InlB B-repeat-containing protein n=1 Tax=Steroidobacter sp. TaxID=1978227 RepID=UPI001A478396|nr:hypothetical protein [Steroidobacter sp.]MBL8265508.1 hypothetical protein [Steroidobacter sp.]